jgi:hypothetical protein
MWSHYADKHSGVCIEFDNSQSQRFVDLTDDDITEGVVNYRAEERINYVGRDRVSGVLKLFLSKSKSWEHEQEYRLILLNHKPEFQKFNPSFVKSVYFGLRVSDRDVHDFIRSVDKAIYSGVNFYKAVRSGLNIKFQRCEI